MEAITQRVVIDQGLQFVFNHSAVEPKRVQLRLAGSCALRLAENTRRERAEMEREDSGYTAESGKIKSVS